MKEILSIVDEQGRPWTLHEQQLQQKLQLQQPTGFSGNRNKASTPKAYWLIRPTDDNQPLRVLPGGDARPVPSDVLKSASQAFFLTCCPPEEASVQAVGAHTPATSDTAAPTATTDIESTDTEEDQIGTTLLWRDENVRIWEFRLPPNVSCAFHKHRRPYFFLNLTASLNQELDRNGQIVPNSLPAQQQSGQCTYVPRDKLGQHAVRNVGKTLFLQFIVEFQNTERQKFPLPSGESSIHVVADAPTAASSTTPNPSSPPQTTVNPVFVGLATTGLIVTGLLLNLLTAAYPLVLWMLLPASQQSHRWTVYFPTVVLVQATHAYLLWTDSKHLAAYRFLTKPIRRAVLPLVMYLIRVDAVKEQEDVAYLQLPSIHLPSTTTTMTSTSSASARQQGQQLLFSILRPSVRRRYRHMHQRFQQCNMRIESVDAETHLNLHTTMPILWAHQHRQSQITNKNVWEEFIKRFLVVSVVPDGVLDLFYNADNVLMGFQMGIRQGCVYHWFMYFCRDEGRQSGIWFMGVWTSLLRAISLRNDGVSCVCGLTHHLESKRNAGFEIARYTDAELLSTLFPWQSTDVIPHTAVHTKALNDAILLGGNASNGKK